MHYANYTTVSLLKLSSYPCKQTCRYQCQLAVTCRIVDYDMIPLDSKFILFKETHVWGRSDKINVKKKHSIPTNMQNVRTYNYDHCRYIMYGDTGDYGSEMYNLVLSYLIKRQNIIYSDK
jgi:hypothetical protein